MLDQADLSLRLEEINQSQQGHLGIDHFGPDVLALKGGDDIARVPERYESSRYLRSLHDLDRQWVKQLVPAGENLPAHRPVQQLVHTDRTDQLRFRVLLRVLVINPLYISTIYKNFSSGNLSCE